MGVVLTTDPKWEPILQETDESLAKILFYAWSTYPARQRTPSQIHKGSIFDLIKGNQWLKGPKKISHWGGSP